MIKQLLCIIAFGTACTVMVSDLSAQFVGRGGGIPGAAPGNFASQTGPTDPRLGYCLKNDCLGGGGAGGFNNCGGHAQMAAPVPRSRFTVTRNGQRVLTYIGTREGFLGRFPQYANKIATIQPASVAAPQVPAAGTNGQPSAPIEQMAPIPSQQPTPIFNPPTLEPAQNEGPTQPNPIQSPSDIIDS